MRDELETYELLDESTLLPPQTSEEWQRETAFAEFLRERDVACKFSSSRPRELTARVGRASWPRELAAQLGRVWARELAA